MSVPAPPIITCPQWHARPARHKPHLTSRPVRALVHHTAGHHHEVSEPANESRDELLRYAHDLQNDMMDRRGWSDSGHNFLIGRNGMIVQGRWGTVTAIQHGRMVVSAHCPGQNDQPGVEHEHADGEQLTAAQRAASVWLYAWICDRCKIRPTELYGHRTFYATSCPTNLQVAIPRLRVDVAALLNEHGRDGGWRRGLFASVRFAAQTIDAGAVV